MKFILALHIADVYPLQCVCVCVCVCVHDNRVEGTTRGLHLCSVANYPSLEQPARHLIRLQQRAEPSTAGE